jgi:hypothetical protein
MHRQNEAEVKKNTLKRKIYELRTNKNIDLTNKRNRRDKGLCVQLTMQRSWTSYPGASARENTHFQDL